MCTSGDCAVLRYVTITLSHAESSNTKVPDQALIILQNASYATITLPYPPNRESSAQQVHDPLISCFLVALLYRNRVPGTYARGEKSLDSRQQSSPVTMISICREHT